MTKLLRGNKLMEINFNLLEKEIFSLLGDKKIMILATSWEDKVTARSMSCVIINRKIYCQTDKTFFKCSQIAKNPNVALCIDNIQIEGFAKIKQHPFAEENKDFIDIFKEKYKGSYENYSHMNNEVVVEIEPTFITLWKYENAQPFRDFLDIKKNKAYREIYNTSI
jgi:general stress protein 26